MLKLKQICLTGLAVFLAGSLRAQPELLDGVAAIVNGKVITFSEVRDYIQPALGQLSRDFSGDELREKVRAAQLDALNNLIDRQLIIDEYNTKGYSLPDNIVDTQIDEVIATDFNNDRVVFVKTLQAENITMSQYRDRMRERIIVQAMRNRKMQQEVVVSPYKIEKYYKEHGDEFKVDDQIKLRMIFIKKAASVEAAVPVAPPVETNAAETAAGTAAATPAVVTPPVDPQRKLAEELLAKLKEGDNFESLAKVYSAGREAKEGGSWGWIGRNILSKQLDAVAFGLKAGQHSDVIETSEGYYLLFVEEVKPAHTKTLAEVRTEIQRNLLQQQRAKMQDEWVKDLRAKAYIRLF